MNKRFGWLVVALLLVVAPGFAADPVDSKARFNSLNGVVELSPDPDSVDWGAVNLKQVIYVGDHIQTGDDSSAILQLEDMSTYVLKANSEIVIETPPAKETKIGLVAGRIWINTKKMFTDGTMQIEMGQAVAGIRGTNIVCGRSGQGDDEQADITAFRGQADLFIPGTGEHFIVEEGQQITIRGGQIQRQQVDVEQQQNQWQNQVGQLGASLGLDDVPDVLRGIRENEGTSIRNLRSSMADLTAENAPALTRAVERFIGVLDENAIILANIGRRIQQAMGSATGAERARVQGLMSAVADVTRSNQANRAEIAQMMRQLRDATSIDLGHVPGRIESIRTGAANGFQAISEQFAALPSGATADSPAVVELRNRITEFQTQLAHFEAELLRIQRQLADIINTQTGSRVAQARTLARDATGVLQAIGGYRQGLQRFNVSRQGQTPDEDSQGALQRMGERATELAERVTGANERIVRSQEAFEQARNIANTSGLAQEQYQSAREQLQAAIDGAMTEASDMLQLLSSDFQALSQQKQDLIAQHQEKINGNAALRAMVNDLNRRFSDISTRLTTLTTVLTKLRGEQSSLLASLNVKPVEDSVITKMKDTEEAMSSAIVRFENELSSYNARAQADGSTTSDRLRASLEVLNSFQKARRQYLSAQRLYESMMRNQGRGATTREIEEMQSTWERISDEYQRLTIAAGNLEAELNRLESQLNEVLKR